MCGHSLHGNREISRLATGPEGPSGPRREGEEPKPPMHDREKSDSAIVAGKPTNKAGRAPAAESVERGAETEGNTGQQRTRRAQDRESVSQTLDRVRHVARQRKKER